jgi:hypothetical protein
LVSGRRAQPSNNRLPARARELAVTIIRERYSDFGPTLADFAHRVFTDAFLAAVSVLPSENP